jgi:hypothetical protein
MGLVNGSVHGPGTIISGEERKPPKWEEVITGIASGPRVYIDRNSYQKVEVENRSSMAGGDILFSYDTPTKMSDGDKEFMVQGVVKTLVAECRSGAIAPIADLFFTEKIPTRKSTPVGGIEYPSDPTKTAVQASKDSVVFNALCPKMV